MKRKVIGLGNIEGSYPRAWNFQGVSKGTICAPCKNIVMLSCLVWKIRSPHFNVYALLWSEKSSGSETSKAPTQGHEIFRVGLRRHRARKHRRPLPRGLNFQGGSKGTIYAPCKIFMYLVFYEAFDVSEPDEISLHRRSTIYMKMGGGPDLPN